MSTRYEYYNTGDEGNSSSIYDTTWGAQTFTPSIAHKITSVKLKLFSILSPGIVTVSIRATDVNNHPAGNDLCSGTINGNTLTTDYAGEWYEIALGSGCNLSASTKYAIVVRAPNIEPASELRWIMDTTNPTYTGGCYEWSENSGTSWLSSTSLDLMFEDWGEAPSIIGFHSTTAQRCYKAATFSTFTFPNPAGSGFTSASDGYYMMAGYGKSGILTAEALGASKVNFRLNPVGIITSEAIPSPQLSRFLYVSGIGSAEAFGTAFVEKMLQIISVTAIPTAEAFGTAFVKKMLQILSLTGIPTTEAFGTAFVAKMLQIIIPSGVASNEAFGTLKTRLYIAASGIISQEIFGAIKANFKILPSGIISQQAFGVAKVNRWILPSGIISQAAFGNARFILLVRPSGIATLQAFGLPTVEKIFVLLRPAGIQSGELFGTVIVITAILLPPVRLQRPPRLLNAVRNLPSDREDGIRRMP